MGVVTLGTCGDTQRNFDRGAHVIVWELKFNKFLLWGVAQNWGYFGGLKK